MTLILVVYHLARKGSMSSATIRHLDFFYLFRLEVAEFIAFALHFPLEGFCPCRLFLCPVSLVSIDTPRETKPREIKCTTPQAAQCLGRKYC